MASLRVKIGAAADQRSFDIVFGQLEKRGVRATHAMAKQFAKLFALLEIRGAKAASNIGKALSGAAPRGMRGRAASEYARPAIEGARKATVAITHEVRKRIAYEKTLMVAQNRERLRAIEREKREEIAAIRRSAAERRRQANAEFSERQRFAQRTSHRATRFLWPNAPIGSIASRTMGDFARGAGVNWHVGDLMSTVTSQQRIATTLSNKAFVQGADGAAGQRVAPSQLIQQSRDLAKRLGAGGTENILQGALAFVNQRGNLAGWNAISEDLVKRAVAQGADISEVGLTAAKIDSALASQGDFATNDALRNRAIIKVMDNLIRQGKVGSIDFDAMSREIPKLSGIAAGITGDTATNISKLMTVAQLAERGPAKNAATASTFAQNFALDLPKRAEAFRDVAGIELFGTDGKTRDLEEIIVETLAATEGTRKMTKGRKKGQTLTQMEQLQELLPNKRSFLALQEFLNVFQGAGGGQSGIEAVRAEFKKFGGSDDQLASDLAQVLDTTANKAERFNAQLEDIVDKVAADLIPALEKASPSILKFAEFLGGAMQMLVERPATALTLAAGAALARAGLESAMRTGIERLILRYGAGGAGGGGGGGGGVPIGTGGGRGRAIVGTASAALGMAAAAWTIKELIVEHAVMKQLEADEKNREQIHEDAKKVEETYQRVVEENMSEDAARTAFGDRGARAARGEMSPEDRLLLEKSDAEKTGGLDAVERLIKMEQAREAQNAELRAALGEGNRELASMFEGIQRGTLKVIVMNPGDIGGGAGGGPPGGSGRASPPMPGPS